MAQLQSYLDDGAGYQARATLMFLQAHCNIEASWNEEAGAYDARVQVARWGNCREQGYVVSLRNSKGSQLNIAFFEHRNTDHICAVKWEQNSIDALTIDTANFGDTYQDKYRLSHYVSCGQASEMADWITEQLEEHWVQGALWYTRSN